MWCNITGEAGGEIWIWSFLGVKGLIEATPETAQGKGWGWGGGGGGGGGGGEGVQEWL